MEIEAPSEIYVKKVLAGNIQDVRLRLIDSIETLGYDVLEEEPNIIARRPAKGWGTWSASANVLDHARALTVRLKSNGENSTAVTFDYSIKTAVLKGDRQIVISEAETIAAISKSQAIEKTCSVCETDSTDDSKFCRRCGAPLTSDQASIEVLRLMAETRAGKSSVVSSSLMTTISAIAMFILFLLNNSALIKPKLFVVLMIFGGITFVIGLIANFFGWNRLKRALDKPESVNHVPKRTPVPLELESNRKGRELPPHRTPASVTEGTTNLLDDEWTGSNRKEKVRVGKSRTTSNFD